MAPTPFQAVISGALGAATVYLMLAPAAGLLVGVCLAIVLGAAGSAALSVVQLGLSRLPAQPLVYAGAGASIGLWSVALPLGAWTKLGGDHRGLALLTIGGTLAWGGALGATAWVAHAPALAFSGSRASWVRRLAIVATLLVLAVLLGVYEVTQGWLMSYPAARYALFFSAWWCARLAALGVVVGMPAPRRAVVAAAAAGLSVALGVCGFARASTWSELARGAHAEHWVALARMLTDFDRDGFSSWFSGGDCAPFSRKVSPGMREVPGNGLDDNCRFGDASSLPGPVTSSEIEVPPPAPGLSVVLVTVDALRADHTTPYGYARDTTPNLAALAARSVRFENAYTSGGWTCLALPSLFAGVYPRRFSWRPSLLTTNGRLLDFPWQGQLMSGERVRITLTVPAAPPAWWLPLVLQQRGYVTLAAGNQGIRPIFMRALERGWDRVISHQGVDDAGTVDLAVAELDALNQPFFLWLHFFDPHDPQTSHDRVPTFGGSMLDRYDHEVASTDRQLGRLLSALEGRADTAVIVSADHGEAFQWGFQFHGNDLFEDSIRIPLVLSAPGLAPGVNRAPASLLDITPTVLGLTKTPVPRGLDGRDLRKLSGSASVLTDVFRVDERGKPVIDQVAVSGQRLRLVRDNRRQADVLTRTRDLGRPPAELPLHLTPPAFLDQLGRYAESTGGL